MPSLPTCPRTLRTESGYALAALLVTVSVMAVLISVALPVWQTLVQREREAEFVFRGEQYARAIALYQRQYANTPPPDLDVLVQQGFLRKRYTDPMVPGGEFVPLTASDVVDATAGRDLDAIRQEIQRVGGIVGVTSSSTAESLRQYDGATRYNEWLFLALQFSQEAGLPAAAEGVAAGDGEEGQPLVAP